MAHDGLRLKLASLKNAYARERLPKSLSEAAAEGRLAWMAHFVEQGADLQEKRDGFCSPLQAAAAGGRLDAVEWLLARGVRLDADEGDFSPLGTALLSGDRAVFERILEAGAPVASAMDSLHGAVSAGRVELLERLVQAGLDLDQPRGDTTLRESLLADAEAFGRSRCAAFLRGQAYAHLEDEEPAEAEVPEAPADRSLRGEARQTKLDEALALLDAADDADLRQTRVDGLSLLAYAAREGLMPVLTRLLDRGLDPDGASEDGATPLILAADGGHDGLIDVLLQRGARIDAVNAWGETALHRAVDQGRVETVQRLLEAGADPHARTPDGVTVMDLLGGPYASQVQALVWKAARRSGPRLRPR